MKAGGANMTKVSRYILINSLIAIAMISVFAFYSLQRYYEAEVQAETKNLEKSIQTFREFLKYKGEGFRKADGRLFVGSYSLNGNYEVPDKVKEIFGGVATIFLGDVRISTNVLDNDGNRAVGTKLTGPAFEAIFKEGKPYRGEANILGIPYMVAYDPIRDGNGEIIGALFVGLKKSDFFAGLIRLKIDLVLAQIGLVTVFTILMVLLGRKARKFEQSNEDQLRFLQALIDTIPSPVYFKDKDGFYLGCNKAFEAGVGTSQAELIGKTAHEIWPKEYADSYAQQDLSLLKNPGNQMYEATVWYADGSLRDVIFNKATFTDKDGEVAGLVGIVQDITERKAAEHATKNAYQQLHDIVDFLPDATFVIDKEKRVIAWNRAIEKMTGLKKEDVIGKGDYIYALPFYGERRPILIDLIDEDVDRIKRYYDSINVEGRTLFGESFVPALLSGEPRFLCGIATPLFDSVGRQAGAIESIRDITEYKRAEEEKIRLESQLNQKHMIETLLVRLGHDLKTPLTPLFILLPLLKERLTEPDLIRKVDMCIKSASALNNLADKTKIFATLSSAVSPSELESISLVSIVNQSIAESEDIISKKQIDCQNIVDPDVIVHAEPEQLHILINNLISNAVYFSHEKGVVVISAEQNTESVMFSIQDEGVGLAPSHLGHVFDELFKADVSRHNINTTGLGLSICKRIVQNHHGRIWAESPGLGKGSTFKFTINNQGPVDRIM